MLFSGTMVIAILDGRKTQTRRIVKPQFAGAPQRHSSDSARWMDKRPGSGFSQAPDIICPHPIGSRIWVKETFSPWSDELTKKVCRSNLAAVYRADFRDGTTSLEVGGYEHWKPSIIMPRWASRIMLEVTGVKVEKLCDISFEDCMAEGIQLAGRDSGDVIHAYKQLWESINGTGFWETNPWVWAYAFKRIKP